MADNILQRIDEVIAQRKNTLAKDSYVASLLIAGRERIARKVGEEAVETVIASLSTSGNPEGKQSLVAEVADLWFHCQVLLAEQDLSSSDVIEELGRRFGVSGLDEKASRDNN